MKKYLLHRLICLLAAFSIMIGFSPAAHAQESIHAEGKACNHSSITNYFLRSEYRQKDENTHQQLDYFESVCNSCNTTVRTFSETMGFSAHIFSGNTCTACGYTRRTCNHSSITNYFLRSEYRQKDANSHQQIDYFESVCNSCNTTVRTFSETMGSSAHIFSGNTCTACGYMKADTCRHPSTREQYWYTRYELNNETHHYAVRYYRLICNNCGKNTEQTSAQRKPEPHAFDNGKCRDCETVCTHIYDEATMQAISDTQAWTMLDDEYHALISQECVAVCSRCSMETTLTTNGGKSQKEKHTFGEPIWMEWMFDAQNHWRLGGRFCTTEGCVYAERMTETSAVHAFDQNGVCVCGYHQNFTPPDAFTQAFSGQSASGLRFLLEEANNPVFTNSRDAAVVEWLQTIMMESLNDLTGGWAHPADLFRKSNMGASASGQNRNGGAVNSNRLAMQLKEYLHFSFNQKIDEKKVQVQLTQLQDPAEKNMLQYSREAIANEIAAEYRYRLNKLNAFQRSFELLEESEYKKALLKAVSQLKQEYEKHEALAWQTQFFFSDPYFFNKQERIEALVLALKALQPNKQPVDAAVVSVLETGLMCGAMLKVEKALMNREGISMMDYLDYQDCAEYVYTSRLSQCLEYRGYSRQAEILQNLLANGQ